MFKYSSTYLTNNKKKKHKLMNIDLKIFSKLDTDKGYCIKLFGIKIFEEYSNEIFRIQKFFGNFVYTQKLRSSVRERKIFKFLNFVILERITENDVIKYNILNYTIRKVNLSDIFYSKYLKNVKYDYDDVYVLHSNSGEAYLFFAYCVKAVLKNNDSKKPLFIATQNYHIDILKMYLPEANVVYYRNLCLRAKNNKWCVKGHNCYMIFSPNHFLNVENDTNKKEIGEVHYLKSISAILNLEEKDYSKPLVIISQKVKQELNEKINLLNLNLDKFVIIAPEAQTCEELPISVWNDIVKQLKVRGFDIFLNIMDQKNFIDGCKSTFLSYQEIFELAQNAKGIISLRSGITEFLLPTNIPNITIYTKFKRRKKFAFSVSKTISAFSMHKFPFVKNELICELNIDDFKNEQDLLSAIMEKFDSMVERKELAV